MRRRRAKPRAEAANEADRENFDGGAGATSPIKTRPSHAPFARNFSGQELSSSTKAITDVMDAGPTPGAINPPEQFAPVDLRHAPPQQVINHGGRGA